MSFFSKILSKLGLGKKDDQPTAAAATAMPAMPKPAAPAAAKPAVPAPAPKPVTQSAPPAAKPAMSAKPSPDAFSEGNMSMKDVVAAPRPISEVDVVAHLEELAAKNPAKLNWKVSIVDLLKLLDLESSFEARKELATELKCPAELMNDSAKMNTWLHKEVLRQIAQNGGNIPKELLD
jgi:hypothetical protein